jgi:hypothetical protein
MTTEQFLLILGTIYIAPHLNPFYCQAAGMVLIGVAACKGLGWI